MDNHLFLLSTMSPQLTRAALIPFDIDFQVHPGTIQKFEWHGRAMLWIACQHPVTAAMADSILPYMDTCVCWYHDQCALSCLRVHSCLGFLEKYHDNVAMMATNCPTQNNPHTSKVRKYYNKHGFLRKFYCRTFRHNIENITQILKN
jgi:hypothetical protein